MSGREQKKNDLRVRYTRQVLEKHLLSLLAEKPLDKITVKELCESAGINRATFYTHYADIYDLMRRIKDRMNEEILFHVESHLRTRKVGERASMIEFLRYLRENRYLYLYLCQESGPNSLRAHTWDMVKEYYLGERQNILLSSEGLRQEISLTYKVFGNTAVIESWLHKDISVEEEALADLLIEMNEADIGEPG
ncbi:MAG: TetR/AcrR family transcriptional regulator [Clostridiales Family XIII bacterium]|jgi:AcrR family transcriptional regulator|nr:TetR/AcrR family transcriptional regulator [Clostridiales Family XIII bacterium]